jgi:hypothetical protein
MNEIPQLDETSATLSVEDRLAIEDLAARYNLAIDMGDVDRWVSCFTDDGMFATEPGGEWSASRGVMNAGWHGREQLTAFAAANAGRSKVRHWSGNRVLAADGTMVRSVSYMSIVALDGPHVDDVFTGVMHDELVHTDAGWRFRSRRIVFDR